MSIWDVLRVVGFPAESLLSAASYFAWFFWSRRIARHLLLATAAVSAVLLVRVVALDHQPWQVALKAAWTASLFYTWWRLGGDDDFRRSRRKLAMRVREVAGRLVAAPVKAGAR